MIRYKLTDKQDQTHDGCTWGIGVKHTIKQHGCQLCTNQVIHYYEDPLLAVFANPLHANFDPSTMHLWECEVGKKVAGDALKSGTKQLTTLRRIPMPVITLEQRVEIAIRVVKTVYTEKRWNTWADKWLSGADRTAFAAVSASFASSASFAASAAASFAASFAASPASAPFASAASVSASFAHSPSFAASLIAIIHSVCEK